MSDLTENEAATRVRDAQRPPLWLLAMITLSGTLSLHIFAPAMPIAAQAFSVSASVMQLTLSAYVIGLAFGQLAHGFLSDRFGRRPVLICGMILYAATSVAATLAPTVNLLIAARFLQALGGSAGLVLGRAIVRDSATGDETAKNLSLMNLMVMLGPGLAPLIGSALAAATGWRSIFAALSLLGFLNLLLIWRLLAEGAKRKAQDLRAMLTGYGRLLKSRRFLGYAFGGGCATTSFYAFVGAAPFIFVDQLNRPIHEIGAYLGVNIIGVWLGSFLTSRLAGRVRTSRLMVVGNLVSCVSAAVFFLFALSGSLSVPSTVLPIALLCLGAGVASPAALAETLNVDPLMAGSISGLYGFTQMIIGAICTALSGLGGDPAFATGAVLLAAGALAQLSFWIAQRATQKAQVDSAADRANP